MRRLVLLLALILSFIVLNVYAQNPPPGVGPDDNSAGPAPEEDPSRGVARISLINGEVSVRRGDSGDVVAAALNAPLMGQDRVLTSSSSRAEVQFNHANILRIGSNSEVRMNDIEERRSQIQVAMGTVTFTVLRNSQTDVEIDTPHIAFRPLGQGAFRVTVRDDGTSEISVRDGEAEIFGPRGTERLRAGVNILARGSAEDPEFREVGVVPLDDWDRWNQSRDQQLEKSRAYDYVSPDIAGAEDLEGYGRWANDPQYGNVWVPQADPGWAPYRNGRWVWEDYYGWTWVSYDPWGWAPYHYGRWYSGSFGWAWYPGPRYSHHYWSPALVAFFGFGGGYHSGGGFGFGNVGWVPLAPHERFHPWWGRGVYSGLGGDRRFANHTTIVNNTNITNVYRNARVNNGITAVGANDFGRHTGRFTGMNGASIRDAGLVRGVLPVTPDRSSLRMADRQVRAGSVPQERNVNFAGRRNSVHTTRVPFEQQQRAMSGFYSGGNAGTASTGQTQGGNQGWRRSGDAPIQQQPQATQGGFSQRGGAAVTPSHGWSRFGEPIHGSVPDSSGRSAAMQTYPPANNRTYRGSDTGAGGWQRFGQTAPGGTSTYQATPQPNRDPSSYDNGTRRFGGTTRYQSAPQSTYQQQPYSQPPQQYNSPRDYGRGSSSQPVRISPPMVHERSAQSGDYSRGGGGGGGARNSGGGGGSRNAPQSSGGGGGSHQSSGGGNHGNSNNNGGGHGGGRR